MLKILIVDDEKIILKAMVKSFEKYGTCTSVEKGIEALKLYQEAFKNNEPFDLIILDYSLDDFSGLDILKEIRDNETQKKVSKSQKAKVIMATGHNELGIVKECIAAGCNNYILKPLKPQILEEKLSKLGIKPLSENAEAEDTEKKSESDGSPPKEDAESKKEPEEAKAEEEPATENAGAESSDTGEEKKDD